MLNLKVMQNVLLDSEPPLSDVEWLATVGNCFVPSRLVMLVEVAGNINDR